MKTYTLLYILLIPFISKINACDENVAKIFAAMFQILIDKFNQLSQGYNGKIRINAYCGAL